MKKNNQRILSLLVVFGLAVGLAGCAGEADTPDVVPGTDLTAPVEDDFVEAIPNEDMLTLTLAEEGQTSQALTIEQELGPNPSRIHGEAVEIVQGVNHLLHDTHGTIERIIQNSEPVQVRRGRRVCRIWEADGPNNHWLLASCRVNARARHYAVALAGRPLASDNDADYKLVFAADSHVLPRHEGRRRGMGRAGYNFDNLNELLGGGPTGKVGIGYRAAGRARQLNIALAEFQPENAEQALSALYRFSHVRGLGGDLRFNVYADFLTLDQANNLIDGQDGLDEFGRTRLTWHRSGAARVAVAVCGGTVGVGACIAIRQCYQANGAITFEEITDPEADPAWEPASCPDLGDNDMPQDDDMEEPGEDENGMPAPPVPEPMDGE